MIASETGQGLLHKHDSMQRGAQWPSQKFEVGTGVVSSVQCCTFDFMPAAGRPSDSEGVLGLF